MAEKSIPQHRTCEICGEESPAGATVKAIWAEAPAGRWIHAGPCYLEFGIVQNTLPGALREAIQRLCQLHRERSGAWKAIAIEREWRLKRALTAMRKIAGVREFLTHRADTLNALLACEDVLAEGRKRS